MRILILASLILASCTQFKTPLRADNFRTAEALPQSTPRPSARLNDLEARLDRIEFMLREQRSERAALVAWNQCIDSCNERFPWLERDADQHETRNEERRSCMDRCGKAPPEIGAY